MSPSFLDSVGLSTPCRILVIEDITGMRERLVSMLRALGHTSVGAAGAHTPDDGKIELCISGVVVATVRPRMFDAVFMDYNIESTTENGGTLTEFFIAGNPQIRVIGMSSEAACNHRMVQLGAVIGVRKREIERLIDESLRQARNH